MQNTAYSGGTTNSKKADSKFSLICFIIQLLLIFVFSTAIFSQAIFAEDTTAEDTTQISIDKTYLKAGDTLVVNNSNGYTLKYYVDGTEQSGTSLKLSSDYYEKWIKVEAYDSSNTLVSEDSAYFSKLPVLYITTNNGYAVTSSWAYTDGTMTVQDNEKISDVMYSGDIQIKGRGNSTMSWPKKPYKIKLDKKTDLFGMGKNKHWVLLANYLDESLLRNTTAFQISNQLGLTTMDTIWTDVVFNGEYVGNYQLCEHIRIGSSRVDIFNWEDEAENIASAVYKAEKKKNNILDKDALEDSLCEDFSWVTSGEFTFNKVTYKVSDYYSLSTDITGGYLFELSEEYDEKSKFTTSGGLKVMLNKPEYLYTNTEMMTYVQNLWANFEKAYKSEDGYVDIDGKSYHYTEIADLDSMISYWLTMEIVGNDDAIYKSRYAYKDVDQLLKFGPVWDFDWGCGSAMVSSSGKNWKITKGYNNGNFYKEFLDDPLFLSKATEKYWEIRPYLEEMFKDNGTLDSEIEYLYESGIADQTKWDRKQYFSSNARGFEKDSSMYKAYMQERLAWLDEQFATDETLLKSTYFANSAYPYVKSDKINIAVSNSIENTSEGNAVAERLIDAYSNVAVEISCDNADTAYANVYVNGIYAGNTTFNDGLASITLDNALFTYDVGEKNVISVIGKNSSDSTTYKTFTSVAKVTDTSMPTTTVTSTETESTTEATTEATTESTTETTTESTTETVTEATTESTTENTTENTTETATENTTETTTTTESTTEATTETTTETTTKSTIESTTESTTVSTTTTTESTTDKTTENSTDDNTDTSFILGDVDFDGVLTANDAAYILSYVLAPQSVDFTPVTIKCANVDGDDAITANDAAAVLQKVLLGELFD